MTDKASPPTKSFRNLPLAFVIGGLICVIGEGLTHLFLSFGLAQEAASSWTSVSLIFLSVLSTGLGLYHKLAKFGGAGTLVPITGFANAVASPALEFKSEGLVLGVGAKMFLIAGPVIVYGISASVLYGLIVYIFGLV